MEFKQGDKVKVTNKNLKTYGRMGIVVYVSGFKNHPTVQVSICGALLTYKKRNLELVSDLEYKDNNNNKGDSDMLMGNYRVCKIRFIEGANTKSEYYYALYDNDILHGDYVVVKSAHNGFGVAIVTDVIPDECVEQAMLDSCNDGREVVARFDMHAYENRVENRKRAKQLKTDMEKKVKAMQELTLYEMMAEKCPELKEMLEVYKELIK